MKMNAIALTGTAAMLGLIASVAPLQAQTPDTLTAYRLDGVTVTTPRGAVDRSLVTQRIDVVTEGEIDRSGAFDVADALRSTSPIDVIAYPGLLTGVSIRGFRPQLSGMNPRTLILLDGRPAGTSNLALIHSGGIERIELLRGPGSTLFGASAMGGIVNVVTRHSAEAISGRVTSMYGSFGVYDAHLNVGGMVASGVDFDLALTAAGQTSGYRTGARRTFGDGQLVKNGDDGTTSLLPLVRSDTLVAFTEYRSRSGHARLGYRLADGWRLDLQGEAFESDGVQNPGDLNPQEYDSRTLKDVGRHSFDLALSGDVGANAPLLRLFSAVESIDYFSAPEGTNFVNFRTPTRTTGGQLQNTLTLGGSSLTLGADITRITAESEAFTADNVPGAPYNPDSAINSAAAFAHGRIRAFHSQLTLQAGARLDQVTFEIRETPNLTGYPANSENHLVLSPNAGARLALAPWLQAYGNVGRAFVTPEAFSVAGYSERRAGAGRKSVFVTRGNSELRPETSWTWDAGAAISLADGLDADIGYFHTDVSDRIATAFIAASSGNNLTPGGDTILSITTYRNVHEAEIQGIEGRLSYELGRLLGVSPAVRLFANGTRILRAEERVVATEKSQRILNVADLTLISGVEFDDFRLASGRFSARYVGERIDSDYVAWWAPGRIVYPAYLVLDLTGALSLGGRYTLGLDIRNLANEDYFEIRGYNQPGRSFRANVGVRF